MKLLSFNKPADESAVSPSTRLPITALVKGSTASGGDDVGGGGFGSNAVKGIGQGVGIGFGLLAFGALYAFWKGKKLA